MDNNIGRLLSTLDNLSMSTLHVGKKERINVGDCVLCAAITHETLVVFASDHGFNAGQV